MSIVNLKSSVNHLAHGGGGCRARCDDGVWRATCGEGGQSDRVAAAHLNAINRLPGPKPWKISFSYGRALQDSAVEAWHGRGENLNTAQQALSHRARCNGAASLGRYTGETEASSASPAQFHEAHDD